MTTERPKCDVVNESMRDAWLGAGLEVPTAKRDAGNAARREQSPDERRKEAARLKRERKGDQRRRREEATRLKRERKADQRKRRAVGLL